MNRFYEGGSSSTCYFPPKIPSSLNGMNILKMMLGLGLLLMFTASLCLGQGYRIARRSIHNEEVAERQVRALLSSLERSIRKNDASGIEKCFNTREALRSRSTLNVKPRRFHFPSIGEIKVAGDSAVVMCSADDHSNFRASNLKLVVRRKNLKWRIEGFPASFREFIRGVVSTSGTFRIGQSKSAALARTQTVPLYMSSRALVPTENYGTPYMVLSRSVTLSQMGVQLFTTNARLQMDAVLIAMDQPHVAFMVDEYWNRIVYGQQNIAGNWIKSYGDHPGDYRFSSICALVTDDFDTVYAVESYDAKIVKLFYNRGTGYLSYVSSFSVPGIGHPVSISWDHARWDSCDGSHQDGFWIADKQSGMVAKITRSGSISVLFTHYQYGGQSYRLMKPTAVFVGLNHAGFFNDFLAIIDEERNAFITADMQTLNGSTVSAERCSQFDPAISKLSCIGMDINDQYLVGDSYGRMFHVFTASGDYECSMAADVNGNQLFSSPSSVSRALHGHDWGDCSHGLYAEMQITTGDEWTDSSGIRMFFPGADVKDPVVWGNGSSYIFSAEFTNTCQAKAEIYDTNNQLIMALDDNFQSAGVYVSREVMASELPTGTLKFRVSVLPFLNDRYASYGHSQTWYTKETQFDNSGSSSTNVVANGGFESGDTYWTFHTDGEGSFDVDAAGPSSAHAAHMTLSTVGSNMQLYQTDISLQAGTMYRLSFAAKSSTGNDVSVYLHKHQAPYTNYGLEGEEFDLGTSWGTYTVDFSTPSEFDEEAESVSDGRLRFWLPPYAANGDQYYLDDVVLQEVISGAPTAITDAATNVTTTGCQLNGTVNPNGYATTYRFEYWRTGDPGSSTIPQGAGSGTSNVQVSASLTGLEPGTLYHYRLVAWNSNGSTNGSEQTFTTGGGSIENLLVNGGFESGDNGWNFFTNGEGSFDVDAAGPSSAHAAHLTLSTVGSNMQLNQADISLQAGTTYRLSFAGKSSTGHDVSVSVIKNGPPYTSYGLSGEEFDLGTSWGTYTVEFNTPPEFDDEALEVSDGRLMFWLPPYAADGDQYYLDDVVLQNTSDIPNNGQASQQMPEIPKETNLFESFPNPFNPSTTIKYALSSAGKVSLIVYDILGRQVALLADGHHEAGYYSAKWNASSFASGIYFARFTVTDELGGVKLNKVNKLLLMK